MVTGGSVVADCRIVRAGLACQCRFHRPNVRIGGGLAFPQDLFVPRQIEAVVTEAELFGDLLSGARGDELVGERVTGWA